VKRILSFDGGGIRGIFSLQIAARIEQYLQEELGRPQLVLSDVVDLFAGTSTGAIIATCLAWGMPVADVERMYLDHGRDMFAREPWWRGLRSKYRADGLARMFKTQFVEDDGTPATLGTSKLKSLLLVVTRNASTGSPWPLSSNPQAKFNDPSLEDCNLRIPLWQILRASTAAPAYFPAQEIRVGSRRFVFVDGGVTPFDNPALLATLMATLPCYRLNWTTGRDTLHVISIGTGSRRSHLPSRRGNAVYLWDNLSFSIDALLGSSAENQDMISRTLGDCLYGPPIDSEVGQLDAPSLLPAGEQKFTYVRYNATMDSSEVGVPLTKRDLRLDNLAIVGRLQEIGRVYAGRHVQRAHLWPRDGRPASS
jgi:Patatin-like phospholipase